jgi:hypothetical protein
MRGNPLDLDYLIRKIAAVDWNPSRRAMQKGWMDVWRREWEFLWTGLNHHLEENPDDKIALNLVRKLRGRDAGDVAGRLHHEAEGDQR